MKKLERQLIALRAWIILLGAAVLAYAIVGKGMSHSVRINLVGAAVIDFLCAWFSWWYPRFVKRMRP